MSQCASGCPISGGRGVEGWKSRKFVGHGSVMGFSERADWGGIEDELDCMGSVCVWHGSRQKKYLLSIQESGG